MAETLLKAVQNTTHSDQLEALGQSLAAVLGKDTNDDSYVATIFEVLKYPNSPTGELQDLLLQAIRNRFPDAPSKKQGFWAMVEWAENDKRFPKLDLASPPSRANEPTVLTAEKSP